MLIEKIECQQNEVTNKEWQGQKDWQQCVMEFNYRDDILCGS